MWVDTTDSVNIGDVGFLAEIIREGQCRDVFRKQPWAKNLSGERVLHGWCGETNNVNREAIGAAEVTAISRRDCYRVHVRQVPDNDARVTQMCEELGVTA